MELNTDLPDEIDDEARAVFLALITLVVVNAYALVGFAHASAGEYPAGGLLVAVGTIYLVYILWILPNPTLGGVVWALALVSAGGVTATLEMIGSTTLPAADVGVVLLGGLIGFFAIIAQPLVNYRDDWLNRGEPEAQTDG